VDWLGFLIAGWGVPLAVYLALQTGAVIASERTWRVAVAAPVPLMIVVLGHMVWAYTQDSSLWPIAMLMVSPGAALGAALLWMVAAVRTRKWSSLVALGIVSAAAVAVASVSDEGLAVLRGRSTPFEAGILLMAGLVIRRIQTAISRRRAEAA
jgi:uncharacterized YccA/Bax inhibitor family protein